jgi:osmotically-inducible protein OsmY
MLLNGSGHQLESSTMNSVIRRIAPIAFAAVVLSACAATDDRQSTGAYIDDVAVTAKVKSALIQAPETKARDIQVETLNGVVQLSGFVDSSEEKTAAERVAKQVAGVARVDNRLSVK